MDVYEIISKSQNSGFVTGIDRSGVNFLDPADAFEILRNGFVYRQELQSRLGFTQFADRLTDGSRVMGIFQNVNPADSTTTTLVCSKEFLYEYDPGTNSFVQIPMAGSAPVGGFGITNNEDYVSGTTYPAPDNSQRFVFCSRGMDDVYYYDGTNVKVFNLLADNPNYTNPIGGVFSKATYVAWFGERINFFMPVVNAIPYPQGILYSGIRDLAGNGDKFNVPGSGQINADTYEIMRGINVISDHMILNFQRSPWTLRKTRDAFNPYFLQKIPAVLGTDASFSAVAWNDEVKSVGKTGFVTTDGRQSLRFDNKIPFFSADDIDQEQFDLTYGGFDRINAQFLFAYRDEESLLTDVTQDSVVVYNYEEKTWSINDQRFSVFGQSDAGITLVMNDIDETYPNAPASWARMDTTEETMNKIGITAASQKTLAGDNYGFVYQINQDFDDYFSAITDITQASSAVVSFAATPFQIGDKVTFENVESMTEINGLVGTVTAATLTSATVDINTLNFTLYNPAPPTGYISKVIEFEAELSPFNPYRAEGRKCYISHVEVLLNTHAGSVYVDVYEDEEEAPFKTVLLAPSSDTTRAREWITFTVDQESNFLTFVYRRESSSSQTIITSIRIHCSKGAFTSS